MYVLVDQHRLPEGNSLIVANLYRDVITPNGPRRQRLGRICSKVACQLTGKFLYDYGSEEEWIPEWSRLLQRMGSSAAEAERLAKQVADGVNAELEALRNPDQPIRGTAA
jgi:hypothetical protein